MTEESKRSVKYYLVCVVVSWILRAIGAQNGMDYTEQFLFGLGGVFVVVLIYYARKEDSTSTTTVSTVMDTSDTELQCYPNCPCGRCVMLRNKK